MILERISVGAFQANCYIIASGKNTQAVIIDPGDEEEKIQRVLARYTLNPGLIVNTHGHIDHIGSNGAFGLPVHIHRKDLEVLKDSRLNLSAMLGSDHKANYKMLPLEDKQAIGVEGVQMQVIHTPGHTAGGICLLLKKPKDKILFSGDTLFYHGVGRTDFPGASDSQILRSIKERLFTLPDDTQVYPGHGPSTTIGDEKANNPFLGEE